MDNQHGVARLRVTGKSGHSLKLIEASFDCKLGF